MIVKMTCNERMKLTLHVVLQLDKIHRSQRPFCIVGRGHVDQLSEQRENNDGEESNPRITSAEAAEIRRRSLL